MKVSHFVTAGMIAVVVVLVGNLLVARYSREGYDALLAHKIRLEQNLADLEQRQSELRGTIELLTRSTDSVRMNARYLGYYGEDELVVRLEGARLPQQSQSPGAMITGAPQHEDRRPIVRLIALAAALLTLLVLILVDGPSAAARNQPSSEMRRASR